MPAPNPFLRLWYRWKALRLPWRRQFLAGHDLAGNTFWEFKDAINANRFRRIVKYTNSTTHYADIQISPQWHQWLRHTRPVAPTTQEQQYELARRTQMQRLAAEADERWKSQPSYLDSPDRQQPKPAIGVKDPGGYVDSPTEDVHKQGVRTAVEAPDLQELDKTQKKASPFEKLQPKGGPSEGWKPEEWTGSIAPRR